MFTINQIKEAHLKVKSGADFPMYVQALVQLGITAYHTFVNDGHSEYYGKDNFTAQSEAKYPPIEIAKKSEKEKFQYYLKIHQQGQTDYMTFCNQAAETGVEKWAVDTKEMTCTYYDKEENKMLVEQIPAV